MKALNTTEFEQSKKTILDIAKKIKLSPFECDILKFVMPSLDDIKTYAEHEHSKTLDNVDSYGLYTDLPFNEKQQYINFLSFAGYDTLGFGQDSRFEGKSYYSGLYLLQNSLKHISKLVNQHLWFNYSL